jgi:NADPH2:quinone reductase
MKAICVHELGGPEVLRYEEIPVPEPQAGQALVKIEAIGLNFVDCNFRIGAYKTALPFTPGMEAAWSTRRTWAPMQSMPSCPPNGW